MVVAVLVSPALGQETLPDRFQHKIRSERKNIEHHVPVERDYRIACEFTGQVGQSGIPPADHYDSPRTHLCHAVDPPELPRAVAETPESRFEPPILRIRPHPREKPIADDETAVATLDEHTDLSDRIGGIFAELEDLGEGRGRDGLRRPIAGRKNQNLARTGNHGHPAAGSRSDHQLASNGTSISVDTT